MSHIKSHPVLLSPLEINPHRPLFVFLPGLDGTGELLRVQTAGLGGNFNVRCLAIPPDDLSSWDRLAEQVIALIEAELARMSCSQVYLCGESFGGCLALKVALKAPQLFCRIILVNPASSFHRRPWIGWSASLVRWLPEPAYQTSAMMLLPFLAALERIEEHDRQALLQAVRSVPQKTSLWRISLLRQFRLDEAQIERLTQPVLLIASGADRLLPSLDEAHYLSHRLPQAKMVLLPDSGHACLLEADVNLAEIIWSNHFLTTKSAGTPNEQPAKP
uniref:Alpha/beta hydrolase fold protein n=1 Tax=Cyanothece sp. (strain PCC 7425 / ATCC 29141) TaxID=395961 RepID=B8HPV3_CYAP4